MPLGSGWRTALFTSPCSPSMFFFLRGGRKRSSFLWSQSNSLQSPSLSRPCKAISQICPNYFFIPLRASSSSPLLSNSNTETKEQMYLRLCNHTCNQFIGEMFIVVLYTPLKTLCVGNILRNYFHNCLSITNYKYKALFKCLCQSLVINPMDKGGHHTALVENENLRSPGKQNYIC